MVVLARLEAKERSNVKRAFGLVQHASREEDAAGMAKVTS